MWHVPQIRERPFSRKKKAPAAIPTARKMLKIRKKTYFAIWTCPQIRERPFFQKKTPAAIPTASQMHKSTLTHTETHIWTNTQKQRDKYTTNTKKQRFLKCDMSNKSRIVFVPPKGACGNTHSESNAQKQVDK